MYTVVHEQKSARLSTSELQALLERGSDEHKIDAMRMILRALYNGDPLPTLMMHIVRFVMPSRNKRLKKLLHLYWEVVPKLNPDGTLKHEMILVCNAIRNDMQHPNEYIQGSTLRFVSKLRERELLEPLLTPMRACLEHRHAYVRKNAVFCLAQIAKNTQLIGDGAALLSQFLASESDATCKRNAFVSLAQIDRDAAYAYFSENVASFSALDETLQLAFVEFLTFDATQHPELAESYLQIAKLALDSSNTVAYDAASALAALSRSPLDLAKAASTYVRIAIQEPDNNTKVIALNRVAALHARAPGSLNDLVMDVLLVLAAPDVDVRKQALDLAKDLTSTKTVANVVRILKKELAATVSQNYDKNAEYRQALIASIHRCAVKFEGVTSSVVGVLLDFLGDFNRESAVGVVSFVKEVVQMFPSLRQNVVEQLLDVLPTIRSASVFRGVLWVIGEYCTASDDITRAWLALRKTIGPLPLSEAVEETAQVSSSGKPKVLADGTYATESSFDVAAATTTSLYPLRNLLVGGEHFLAAALAASLTKLVIRAEQANLDAKQLNGMRAEALLLFTSLLRSATSEDSSDRIYECVQLLLGSDAQAKQDFVDKPHDAYASLLEKDKLVQAKDARAEREKTATSVDAPVRFRAFDSLSSATPQSIAAVGAAPREEKISSQLKHIYQLSGYSDPIYAEAHMSVNQFDIVLDVMIFNQTTDTLQKLCVEFFARGDLKVVDSPEQANVPPMSFHTVQCTIRVASADSGVICGNIVYEGKTASEGQVIILDEIPLNVLDYIKPAQCSESEFRDMWSKFEWENKVAVSSSCGSLSGYVEQLMKHTNMACLTTAALDPNDQCDVLSANFYARSLFGEDAIANLSIERSAGAISGHFRIRSKTQGPALSIGNKVADIERK